MSLIRIAILDGDPLIIAGKHLLLDSQPELLIVYEQANALQAIAELPELLVDVILIDQRLKGMDGVATAKKLRAAFAQSGQSIPPMILSAPYSSQELLSAAEDAGIRSVVTIESEPAALLSALRNALAA